MKVALNLRSANLAIPDGHGESMRNLTGALIAANPGHSIELLVDAPLRFGQAQDPRARVRRLGPFPFGNRRLRSMLGADPWYRARVCFRPAWRRLSAYLQSAHEPTPLLSGPHHLAVVHDVAFMRPGGARFFDAATWELLDLWTAENVHRAAALVAVSPWVRDEVSRVYGIPSERIHVAPHGVDARRFRPDHDRQAVAACQARHGIEPPYVLFVGTLQPRKNLGTLVDAFLQARSRGLRATLVIAGRKGWRYQDVAPHLERGAGVGVRVLGAVPPEDLPLLFAGARAFASLALDEGFGMPALEAMASGVPVIVSDQAGLAYVCGAAGLRVDPQDPDSVANVLIDVSGDQDRQRELRARGLERAAEFTWERAARAVWRAVEQACASC